MRTQLVGIASLLIGCSFTHHLLGASTSIPFQGEDGYPSALTTRISLRSIQVGGTYPDTPTHPGRPQGARLEQELDVRRVIAPTLQPCESPSGASVAPPMTKGTYSLRGKPDGGPSGSRGGVPRLGTPGRLRPPRRSHPRARCPPLRLGNPARDPRTTRHPPDLPRLPRLVRGGGRDHGPGPGRTGRLSGDISDPLDRPLPRLAGLPGRPAGGSGAPAVPGRRGRRFVAAPDRIAAEMPPIFFQRARERFP